MSKIRFGQLGRETAIVIEGGGWFGWTRKRRLLNFYPEFKVDSHWASTWCQRFSLGNCERRETAAVEGEGGWFGWTRKRVGEGHLTHCCTVAPGPYNKCCISRISHHNLITEVQQLLQNCNVLPLHWSSPAGDQLRLWMETGGNTFNRQSGPEERIRLSSGRIALFEGNSCYCLCWWTQVQIKNKRQYGPWRWHKDKRHII